jgi:hypothetical protein
MGSDVHTLRGKSPLSPLRKGGDAGARSSVTLS